MCAGSFGARGAVLRVPDGGSAATPAPPGSHIEDFDKLDIRVGRILQAAPLEGALKPAYRLILDFGNGEVRQSSAQLVGTYPEPAVLIGRLIVAVVNFPPRRVAGWRSDVLVLGALPSDGRIPLLSVDEGAARATKSASRGLRRILPGGIPKSGCGVQKPVLG